MAKPASLVIIWLVVEQAGLQTRSLIQRIGGRIYCMTSAPDVHRDPLLDPTTTAFQKNSGGKHGTHLWYQELHHPRRSSALHWEFTPQLGPTSDTQGFRRSKETMASSSSMNNQIEGTTNSYEHHRNMAFFRMLCFLKYVWTMWQL